MTGVSEPDYRSTMPWDVPAEDLRPLFRGLIALRNKNDTLALGTFRSVWAKGSLYIYRREWESKTVAVALNAGPAEAALPVLNTPDSAPILCWMYRDGVLGPFGCAVWSEGKQKQPAPIF
jgi:glycosidase